MPKERVKNTFQTPSKAKVACPTWSARPEFLLHSLSPKLHVSTRYAELVTNHTWLIFTGPTSLWRSHPSRSRDPAEADITCVSDHSWKLRTRDFNKEEREGGGAIERESQLLSGMRIFNSAIYCNFFPCLGSANWIFIHCWLNLVFGDFSIFSSSTLCLLLP